MNLDLGEGEPRGAEHIFRRSGTGGRRSWSAGRTARPWRAWGAVAAICAVGAIATGYPALTLAAVFSCLAGITLLTRDTRGVLPRRTGGTRASGLTLRARRADVALLAVRSRLARPIHTRGTWGSGRPRRSSGTWSANDTSTAARRRARRADDAVDDRPGEGQGR